MHLATGLKQKTLPTREPTDAEIAAHIASQAARRGSSGGGKVVKKKKKAKTREKKPLLDNAATAGWRKFAKKQSRKTK